MSSGFWVPCKLSGRIDFSHQLVDPHDGIGGSGQHIKTACLRIVKPRPVLDLDNHRRPGLLPAVVEEPQARLAGAAQARDVDHRRVGIAAGGEGLGPLRGEGFVRRAVVAVEGVALGPAVAQEEDCLTMVRQDWLISS